MNQGVFFRLIEEEIVWLYSFKTFHEAKVVITTLLVFYNNQCLIRGC